MTDARSAGRAAGSASARYPLQLAGAGVAFDGSYVFQHIDLAIERGSFTLILGPNGSGKTTMVRAMLGLQPLTEGQALIEGVPVAKFRDWGKVAFVPQRLINSAGVPVSALEVVRSGLVSKRSRGRLISKADTRRACQALESVDLLNRRHSRMDTLSGGQQRRVMIARALAAGAQTLVLDEPFAGVDLASQQSVAELLAKLHGKTIVMVSHGLGPVADLMTRAVVVDGGGIAHDADHAPDWLTEVAHHSSESRGRSNLLDS